MHYVFHPEHEAKVVDTQTYYGLLENGWYDSPGKFPSNVVAEVAEVKTDEPKELVGLAAEEPALVKPKGKGKKEA